MNALTFMALALGFSGSVWAQNPADPHAGHHGGAAMAAAAPAEMSAPTPAPAAASGGGERMSGMSGMGEMDHGQMNMQGGAAPADARDPHAYAGGNTLESGAYVLPGPRQLRLADEHRFGGLLVDRLENVRIRNTNSNATAYDARAWYGNDYDRLVLKAEGEHAGGRIEASRTELLWGHAIASYWDTQLGVRFDSGDGPSRNWLAFGVQGLAPYWFEVDATAYLGDQGRSVLRLSGEYELLLTQRLVLQPRAELTLYGKSDAAAGVGSGLSDGIVGLRLRYEISRQFAPYIGIERSTKFGATADLARAGGEPTGETRLVAGVRFWF